MRQYQDNVLHHFDVAGSHLAAERLEKRISKEEEAKKRVSEISVEDENYRDSSGMLVHLSSSTQSDVPVPSLSTRARTWRKSECVRVVCSGELRLTHSFLG